MELTGFFALAIAAAFCALSLKKYAPETSVVIAVAASAVLLIQILSRITPIINEINTFVSAAGIDSSYGIILIKTVGICFVCQFVSDACRDAGQASLASKVELASKISIIVISLPLFENILNTAAGLLIKN